MKTYTTEIKSLHNLVPVAAKVGVYRPLGEPITISPVKGRLLCAWRDSHVITSAQGGLFAVNIDTAEVSQLAKTTAYCAAGVSDNRIAVMTDAGCQFFSPDGSGELEPESGEQPEWPPISITAEAAAPVTMRVEGAQLSRRYSPADSVSASDTALIHSRLATSYRALCADTAAQGVFFQPLMARAVIRDSYGAILHRSPEVLIIHPEGLPFDRAIELPLNDDGSTAATALSVPTFRLRVRCEASSLRPLTGGANRLDIETSPCFHPWQKDVAEASGKVNVVRNTTSATHITAFLPGVRKGLSITDVERNRRLIETMITALDNSPIVVASFPTPFERGIDQSVGAYSLPELLQQVALTEKFENNRLAFNSATVVHRLNPPHRFTCAQIASTPRAVAFGNVKGLLYPGYSPMDYAAGFGSVHSKWKAQTTIYFRDGRYTVRHSSGTDVQPVALGPVITYPDAEAVAMEILLQNECDSTVSRWYFNLQPDATGRRAMAVSDNLTPFVPEQVTGADVTLAETPHAIAVEYPGLVAVAQSDRPRNITSVTDVGAEITGIVTAASTAGAWDFGRTRFTVFTSDKTVLLNASSDLATLASGKLASVGIADRYAAATTDTAVTYFIAANGNIYRINGSRVSLFACPDYPADRLAFDAASHTLMACKAGGEEIIRHIDLKHPDTPVTSGSFAFDTPVTVGASLLVASPDGIADMAINHRTGRSDNVSVRMTVHAHVTATEHAVDKVLWHCSSSFVSARMNVYRTYLSGDSAPTSGYRISGRLNAPLPLSLPGRPLKSCILEFSGEVAPNTTLSLPSVVTKPLKNDCQHGIFDF